MSTETAQDKHAYFWGVLRSQAVTLLVISTLLGAVFGTTVALAAAWGATITLLSYAWAGFQLWLHPGNRNPHRAATSAVRAEVGKVAIMLLLFWLTFRHMPVMTQQATAAALLVGFFFAQLAGFIWLARNAGGSGEISPAKTDDD